MVSENQSNAGGDSYRNEAHRILASGMNPRPMIRGIEDEERALMYHREAHKLDSGTHIKKVIAEKLRELRE